MAIVEAARALGCDVVLSEDLADGQDYGGVLVHTRSARGVRNRSARQDPPLVLAGGRILTGMGNTQPTPARSRLLYAALALLLLAGLVAFGLMSLFELSFGVAVGWTVALAVGVLLLLAVLVG